MIEQLFSIYTTIKYDSIYFINIYFVFETIKRQKDWKKKFKYSKSYIAKSQQQQKHLNYN